MAGRGPAPKLERRNKSDVPIRGELRNAPGVGWQHGPRPPAPPGLLAASRVAWETWMGAWFAAHWTPEDVPGLRQLIRLYDRVERGEFTRHGEMRMMMDTYGITPKGQQDRRWLPPKEETQALAAPAANPYAHLRVINE